MDNVIRLLMRFILVPLGYLAGVIGATLVIAGVSWRHIELTLTGHPDGPVYAMFALFIGAPMILLFMLIYMAPAAIGILISEAFAIRSWIFHVLNGVITTWLCWQFYAGSVGQELPFDRPLVVTAAGIVGGFAYWAVAGWTAGFYKPIFKDNPPPSVPATTR